MMGKSHFLDGVNYAIALSHCRPASECMERYDVPMELMSERARRLYLRAVEELSKRG